jgi:hypothetical protein
VSEEIELTDEDLNSLKEARSKEFKEAFKIIMQDLVTHASVPSHIDMACGVDNRTLCYEAIKEFLKEKPV